MLQTDSPRHTGLRPDHDVAQAAPATATAIADPAAPAAPGELLFQRCLWCGTAAYRRPFCRACGSTVFKRERSAGAGALVRRVGQVPLNTWLVAMDEGFTLVCRITRRERVVVAVGARVRVVRAVAPLDEGIPLVEPTYLATSSEPWW
jgi:uncharacterized protein